MSIRPPHNGLVLYRPLSGPGGGRTQAQTIAQQAIDATNTLTSTQDQPERRIVGAEFTAWVDSNFRTELSNLRADATTRAVENLRADLVAMLQFDAAAASALMGGRRRHHKQRRSGDGPAVAVGNLALRHEWITWRAHNLRMADPTYPYGYGHY